MIKLFTVTDGSLREYLQGVRLDGVDYILKLSWNGRRDHWVLSLYLADAAATPIVQGRQVVLYTNLLRAGVVVGTPPGQLFAFATDSRTEHPGLTGLGTRTTLAYRPQEEL